MCMQRILERRVVCDGHLADVAWREMQVLRLTSAVFSWFAWFGADLTTEVQAPQALATCPEPPTSAQATLLSVRSSSLSGISLDL